MRAFTAYLRRERREGGREGGTYLSMALVACPSMSIVTFSRPRPVSLATKVAPVAMAMSV